jgi:aminoglycoside phosphotransferase (APT) family kinase protein
MGFSMSTPDLGPVPERITIEVEQVRRLVDEQLPHWAGLPIEPVVNGGWDNRTFHLGTEMLLRLPSAAEYAQAVEKEHRWLPVLAPRLPLPVPVPLAKGRPSAEYPYSWSVYRWLDGVTATPDRIADPVGFADDLAGFLVALRSVDATDGPQPGIHNWYRGGTLRTYDALAQSALEGLAGHVDVDLAGQAWADSCGAPWDGPDLWFHGDVAQQNLLLEDGKLSAVIDFGTCGVGDPSCDLAVAWTLLTPDGRELFRDRLGVDTTTWTRGRGWALWKTLTTCWYASEDPEDADDFATAKDILDTILVEYVDQRARR